jgi:superfamily II DNA or RNA helicase
LPDFYGTAGEFDFLARRGSGWRLPQLGAMSACVAHWTLGDPEPPLVSLPTGLGKTGVALAAPFLQAPVARVLVVVPSQVLRKQLADAFRSQALLRRGKRRGIGGTFAGDRTLLDGFTVT